MINFKNIEELVPFMFEKTDNDENLASVIANKEIAIDVMKELLNYENVILDCCEIDYDEDYNREYTVLLLDDTDSDKWYVSVEKCYNETEQRYFSTGGYVLFHEDTNSKAIIDMKSNDFMPLEEYDCFAIGEETDENTPDDSSYFVNGTPVSKDEFNSFVKKIIDNDDNSLSRKDEDIACLRKTLEYEMTDIMDSFLFHRFFW